MFCVFQCKQFFTTRPFLAVYDGRYDVEVDSIISNHSHSFDLNAAFLFLLYRSSNCRCDKTHARTQQNEIYTNETKTKTQKKKETNKTTDP